jgi:hypothetical protein
VSDPASWQEGNTQYLSMAVAWLRTCLEQRGADESVPTTLAPPQPKEEPRSFWQQLVTRPTAETASGLSLVPSARPPSGGVHTERTAADLAAAAQMDPPPALVILGHRLGLSQFEQEALLLCAAMELDTSIAALCARAQRDPARAYPTFALFLTLFDRATAKA